MKTTMKEKAVDAFLLFLILAGVLSVTSMSFNDEVAEEEFYCEQVLAGHWPDYKQIADEVCSGG